MELAIQQLRSLEGFLAPLHPLNLLPIWARPKAFSNLGNDVINGINGGSQVVVVVAEDPFLNMVPCLNVGIQV